jgi:hypothetical protein
MDNIKKLLKYLSLVLLVGITSSIHALAPLTIFRPTDRFLIPPRCPGKDFQFTVGYEHALCVRAFQDTEDCFGRVRRRSREGAVNPLQLWQSTQNLHAALRSVSLDEKAGEHDLVQLFNDNEGCHLAGEFKPYGVFKVPVNLMFAARWHFDYGLSFGLFIPYYHMELQNVNFVEKKGDVSFEKAMNKSLTEIASERGGLSLKGWKRQGIGDLVAQGTWKRDYIQTKPFLRCVSTQLRFGLSIPTGLKQDENKILAFPFGNDGSWGLQIAGGLDLLFAHRLRGGLDAEFLYLFGNTRDRRIRAAVGQTDLLFFNKNCAFKEYGLGQQYNIYVETFDILGGLSVKLNYQYLKRNEDKLYVKNDGIDSLGIVNNAQSLQNWTAHTIILGVNYNFCRPCAQWPIEPYVSLWYKHGFNGKNALLANTVGASVTVNF